MVGRTVSHYRISARLGEGGMGVVYKALDTRLDRPVALKFLAPARVADPDRKRRFFQEAKAASALNHPNIITVYDVGEFEGADFIAMEYVEGKPLDQLIGGKGLALKDTLKCATQVAAALAKAHGAGIVHRDIKPGNVMVTPDGLVKVLDFGLAKLTEIEAGEDEATRTLRPATQEGAIVGTAAYMSPEQAEGRKVDARSDIFSFGALLYEMVTGRRAFGRESTASTLAAILKEEPQPVSQINADTPRDLEKVIARCLRKDPARRFQGMPDVQVALEELKEESESGVLPAAMPPRRSRRRMVLWSVGALATSLAIGAGVWFKFQRRSTTGATARVSMFAGRAGLEWGPALSPDGKQIAFVWNGEKEDNDDIYVQLVDEASPRRLTTDPAFDYSPVWSPDALRIAFLRQGANGTEVIVVPAAGGAERRLHVSTASCQSDWRTMARQHCGLAWSPNGKFLAIVDRESARAPNSIFLLDLQTREKRRLTTPPLGSFGDGVSAFSPDSGTLAFARRSGPFPLSDIYLLPLSDSGEPGGQPRRITHDNCQIQGLDWTGDGRRIVFSSWRGGMFALWQVAGSGGEPERLTVGSESSYLPSVARKGGRLAYTLVTYDTNIWRVAAPGAEATGPESAPKRFTPSPQVDQEPEFSADGKKVAWSSMHSGNHQIWISNSDGSQTNRLTDLDPPGAASPRWSPDGRQILFESYSRGPTHISVIDSEGGSPRRLTTGDFWEWKPSWSRNGKWVYFVSDRGEGTAVWKVPAGGGSPVLVVRNAGGAVLESFDGTLVYYTGPDASIWKVPTAGGEATLVQTTGKRAAWTLSVFGIYVLDPDAKGGPAIEFFPFAPGKRTATVKLPGKPDGYTGVWSGPAASPDGRWILYAHVDRSESDIMLVENFR